MKNLIILAGTFWGLPIACLFLISKLKLLIWIKLLIWMSATISYNYFIFKLMKDKSPFFGAIISTILLLIAIGIFGYLKKELSSGGFLGGGDCEMNRMGSISCV